MPLECSVTGSTKLTPIPLTLEGTLSRVGKHVTLEIAARCSTHLTSTRLRTPLDAALTGLGLDAAAADTGM